MFWRMLVYPKGVGDYPVYIYYIIYAAYDKRIQYLSKETG